MVTNLFWSTQHRLCVVHEVCSIKSIYQCLALFMQATLWMTSELVLQVLALLKHFSQPDSSLFFCLFWKLSSKKHLSGCIFLSVWHIIHIAFFACFWKKLYIITEHATSVWRATLLFRVLLHRKLLRKFPSIHSLS